MSSISPTENSAGAFAARAEDGAVEVGQGPGGLLDVVAVRLQVADDLAVRIGVDQGRRARKSHRNGTSVHDPGEVRHEARRGQADTAALAAAGDRHPAGVDGVVAADRLDRAHRVGEDAPVVVGRRIEDALGHEAGLRGRPSPSGSGVSPMDQLDPCPRVSITRWA